LICLKRWWVCLVAEAACPQNGPVPQPDGTIDPDMPMAPAEANPPPQPTTAWHAMPAAQVLAALQGDPTNGLSQAEAQRRLAQHGPIALPEALLSTYLVNVALVYLTGG
jgi:hypothetical protein